MLPKEMRSEVEDLKEAVRERECWVKYEMDQAKLDSRISFCNGVIVASFIYWLLDLFKLFGK